MFLLLLAIFMTSLLVFAETNSATSNDLGVDDSKFDCFPVNSAMAPTVADCIAALLKLGPDPEVKQYREADLGGQTLQSGRCALRMTLPNGGTVLTSKSAIQLAVSQFLWICSDMKPVGTRSLGRFETGPGGRILVKIEKIRGNSANNVTEQLEQPTSEQGYPGLNEQSLVAK